MKQSTNDTNLEVSTNQMMIGLDDSELVIAKEDSEMVDLIQSIEPEDPDNDVEYVTVILANDESTDSGDENIEVLDDDAEYTMTEESLDDIPKMTLRRHQRQRRNKDAEDRSLQCQECGKTLSNFSSYKYHMQLHSNDTPFLCAECGEGFKTRNAYDGHLVTHMESNPNKCEVCGKCYRQAASLRSHQLTHTGEKPFKCEVCGKGMTQKSGYKKHLLTHSGEKVIFTQFFHGINRKPDFEILLKIIAPFVRCVRKRIPLLQQFDNAQTESRWKQGFRMFGAFYFSKFVFLKRQFYGHANVLLAFKIKLLNVFSELLSRNYCRNVNMRMSAFVFGFIFYHISM